MRALTRGVVLALLLAAVGAPVSARGNLPPEVEAFIAEMAERHGFEAGPLRTLFSKLGPSKSVLRAISTPGTARPWHEFRSRAIDPVRIKGGIQFWREHAAVLARASREYGVPEEIIVAIIGIETQYGRQTGSFRVLEALATLAFHYPPRAELFRNELEAYLLLTREKRLEPTRIRGSYAGAIGIPQFLPSSYRRYAVDFDGDGRRDLINTPADAIGSVANYYRAHGWQTGGPVVVPVESAGEGVQDLLDMGIRPQLTISELRARGVIPRTPVDGGLEAAIFSVEAQNGRQLWLGLNNFYVITRYNRSVNYAMAVYELAQELRGALSGS